MIVTGVFGYVNAVFRKTPEIGYAEPLPSANFIREG